MHLTHRSDSSLPPFLPPAASSSSPPPADRVKAWSKEKDVYRRLKEVPEKALASSGYSEVNLSKLFQAFSSLK